MLLHGLLMLLHAGCQELFHVVGNLLLFCHLVGYFLLEIGKTPGSLDLLHWVGFQLDSVRMHLVVCTSVVVRRCHHRVDVSVVLLMAVGKSLASCPLVGGLCIAYLLDSPPWVWTVATWRFRPAVW